MYVTMRTHWYIYNPSLITGSVGAERLKEKIADFRGSMCYFTGFYDILSSQNFFSLLQTQVLHFNNINKDNYNNDYNNDNNKNSNDTNNSSQSSFKDNNDHNNYAVSFFCRHMRKRKEIRMR